MYNQINERPPGRACAQISMPKRGYQRFYATIAKSMLYERRENTSRAVLVHHKSSIIVSSVCVGIEE
jgi:hypothetical protein